MREATRADIIDIANEWSFAVELDNDGQFVLYTYVYESEEARERMEREEDEAFARLGRGGAWERESTREEMIVDSRLSGGEEFQHYEMDLLEAEDAMACHACVGVSIPLSEVLPEIIEWDSECRCDDCMRGESHSSLL